MSARNSVRSRNETSGTGSYAIIAEQAVIDVADVSDGKTLDDLGIDSLGLVESIFAIEEAFDIYGAVQRQRAGRRAISTSPRSPPSSRRSSSWWPQIRRPA